MSVRRAILGAGAILIAFAALAVAAPQQVGGPITLVSTYGNSMLPAYGPSDLVVVARTAMYVEGDVVAYTSETLDTTILHRIVGEDVEGYITQGDNNDWLDPDRPTDEEILGTSRLRVPHVGRLLELPLPIRAAMVTGLAALAIFGGTAPRHRRGRDRRRSSGNVPSFPDTRSDPASAHAQSDEKGQAMSTRFHDSASLEPAWAGWPGGTAALAGISTLAAGVLLVAATFVPSTQPGDVTYSHNSAFDYTTAAPRGLVYPEGEVTTGEPVFLRLVDRLDLAYTHEVVAGDDTPGQTPTGDLTGRLWLEISDGSGWSHRRPLGPEEQSSGGQLAIEERLDVPAIRDLVEEIREESGASGSSEKIEVTAEITVDGELAGTPISDNLSPTLGFDLTEHRLAPRTEGDEAVGISSEDRTVTVAGAEAARLEFVGRGMDVADARLAGLGLLVLALLTFLVAGIAAVRHGRLSEADRLHLRYRSRMVEVSSLQPPPNHGSVVVRDMEMLANLAQLSERPILHHVDDGLHTYVVEDETTQYRYLLEAEQEVAPEDDDTVVADVPAVEPVPPPKAARVRRRRRAKAKTPQGPDSAESVETQPEPAAPLAPEAAPELDSLESLFELHGAQSRITGAATPPSEHEGNGHVVPEPEEASQPRARVAQDFFANGAWSARG